MTDDLFGLLDDQPPLVPVVLTPMPSRDDAWWSTPICGAQTRAQVLAGYVEQIKRDVETLAAEEAPCPGRQFYLERIGAYRQAARALHPAPTETSDPSS